uniref:Apple domain-containing protein n=1 Tax=Meloidogyne floridensis TaxID=298350 RepID=A0A915P7C7_9BILA
MLPEIVPLFLSFSTTSVSTTLFLLHFFFDFFIVPNYASCMPVFFAQAISSRQVRTMELEDVPSAADCATLCGQRHFFCQSAIYNHDVRSCALSPNRPIQCSLSKQRFNYFHLKTDGADALSLLACIQICQPTTSTTINSLTENVLNKEETKRTTIKQQQSLEFSPIHDEEEKSSLRNKKVSETKKCFNSQKHLYKMF